MAPTGSLDWLYVLPQTAGLGGKAKLGTVWNIQWRKEVADLGGGEGKKCSKKGVVSDLVHQNSRDGGSLSTGKEARGGTCGDHLKSSQRG